MIKRLSCLLLSAITAVLFVLPSAGVSAETEAPQLIENETLEDGMLIYTKSHGGVYVTSYQTGIATIKLGSEIDGYKVLGIYDGAFSQCESLKSVEIAEGIEYIGKQAFYGCVKLKNVSLPESVTSISEGCFQNCAELTEAPIPDTIKHIGDYAFFGTPLGPELVIPEGVESLGYRSFSMCENITGVSLPSTLKNAGSLAFMGCPVENYSVSENNNYYTVSDGVLFSKDMTMLELYPQNTGDESYSVPDSVLYIQPGAFSGSSIQSVTMSDKVQGIGDMAFFLCDSLDTVKLSSKITEIKTGTFSDCGSLKKIDIPESVTAVGDLAFYGCSSLRSIAVPEGVTSIGESAFGFADDQSGERMKLKDFRITGVNYDSEAGRYARENGIDVDYSDTNKGMAWLIIGIGAAVVIVAAAVILIKRRSKKQAQEETQ